MDTDQTTPAPREPRRRRYALAAAAGVAGLVLGFTGVASAQTPTPSAGETATQSEDCPQGAGRGPAERGGSTAPTTPEETSDAV